MNGKLRVLAVGLGLAALAFGAETVPLAGKWSGTVDVQEPDGGEVISTPVLVRFDEPQSGAVSGKIGREGETDVAAIQNGRLEGNELSFEASSGETGGTPMKFTLVLDGKHLRGKIKGPVGSQTIEGLVELSREE